MNDKITGLYNIDSNNGMVSSLQLYEILYWINHSKALTNHETRIPKRDREYIISHFNLVYNEKMRRYTNSPEKVFEIIKKDYPDFIKKQKISNYNELLYKATI